MNFAPLVSSPRSRRVRQEVTELSRAKAFLEKQKRSLKRRQVALTTASQELVKDMSQQVHISLSLFFGVFLLGVGDVGGCLCL